MATLMHNNLSSMEFLIQIDKLIITIRYTLLLYFLSNNGKILTKYCYLCIKCSFLMLCIDTDYNILL